MFLSLGLPIGTILFLSVVLIMYLFKKKYHDFRNKLFLFLMIFTFLLLFVEIAYITTMNNMDKIPFINEVVCRLFLSGILIWVLIFFFYIVILGQPTVNEKTKLFYKKIPTLIIIICLTLSILDCFFKVEYVIGNGLFAIVGPAAFFVYGVTAVLLLILFIIVIRNKQHYSESLKIPMYFALFLIVCDTIHLFVFEINNLTLILSLIVCSLYFTTESQDRLLLKEVEEAKQKSEELNKAKTDFLSNMSHEIRTPMNTILGFSNSLLADQNLTREKVIEDAKCIQEASNNLLDLINNILELSRIESNKEEINLKDYQLKELINEIKNTLDVKTNLTNNWYDINVNEEIPASYNGDYSKILKIVKSLILNAIKFTSYGYISVSIDYITKEDTNYLSFEITNSGSKMPIDYYNSDFADFRELDYTNDNKLDSELLGLVIAKRLLNLFEKSSINFEIVDEVTKCIINIPQKAISSLPIGKSYLTDSKVEEINCYGKKVLVVDDNELNNKLTEKLLSAYNFEVTKASDGKECIDLVKMNDYDLILLDHLMPDMDGVKTLEVLKSLSKKIPPVIAMTANSNVDSKDYYLKLGFDNYISKPVNKNRLDQMISEYFGGKK